jgi:hypothetical protein
MRRFLYLCVVACVVGLLAWRYGATVSPFGAVTAQSPNPEDAKISNGVFTSRYFDLSYPLPQGWTDALAGPEPSYSGYYVLGTFAPKDELTGTILIAAQDTFFSAKPHDDAASAAKDFRQAIAGIEGMTIDREPLEMTIARRPLHRVDFSGVGLFRAMFVAEIRCHLVSFNLTARDPEQLANLTKSLDNLSLASARDDTSPAPICIKDYAVADNLLQKVEPPVAGIAATPIPVRIIIGTDGAVKHVHAIRATVAQRKAIDDSVRQWRFRPYTIDGRAVEIETGLTFPLKQS